MNSTLSQTKTAKSPITAKVWQTLMKQLNRVNQDNELMKRTYKKKVHQNQTLVTKAKMSTKDTGIKGTKAGKKQLGKQKTGNDKTTQAMV